MNAGPKTPLNVKIFIVEDDGFMSSLLVKKFESVGAIVSTDISGETAAANIKKFMPDIVVLDIVLPGADGFRVLQQLKADPETEKIPVVMLSNLAEKAQIDKARKFGAVSYLVKATLSVDEIIGEIAKQLKAGSAMRG